MIGAGSRDGAARFSSETLECPANAGIGWRAGFQTSPSGWRFAYFVAGD